MNKHVAPQEKPRAAQGTVPQGSGTDRPTSDMKVSHHQEGQNQTLHLCDSVRSKIQWNEGKWSVFSVWAAGGWGCIVLFCLVPARNSYNPVPGTLQNSLYSLGF